MAELELRRVDDARVDELTRLVTERLTPGQVRELIKVGKGMTSAELEAWIVERVGEGR